MRAYATAIQPPTGPVYLSLPLDDWHQPADGIPIVRQVSTRQAPDPDRLWQFATALAGSRNPALVIGAGIDRSGAWDMAIRLAEKLRAPVWLAPLTERIGFPEDHPQYQGWLPPAIGPLARTLQGYDVVLVLGAPVFRYYPYAPGPYLPEGTRLLQCTDDPDEAARAPMGESLLGDPGLICFALAELVPASDRPLPAPRPTPPAPTLDTPLSPEALFATLAAAWPADGILVAETPSNTPIMHSYLRIKRPASYFMTASGGLGFALPAAVGIALAERHSGRGRPVIAVIGDGSFQYSVQALWTAAQYRLPVVFVVPVNQEYAILKAFAGFEKTPGVPGLDLPGLDIPTIARGFGCEAHTVESAEDLVAALGVAVQSAGPTVLAVPITTTVPPLI
jgi:benzoylformate decarboxylase